MTVADKVFLPVTIAAAPYLCSRILGTRGPVDAHAGLLGILSITLVKGEESFIC